MNIGTAKDIEEKLITVITALVSGTLHRFASVIALAEYEFRADPQLLPSAIVFLSSDDPSETRSRLIVNETYTVRIQTAKVGKDTARSPYALCDAVRDAIHGQSWGYDDIDAFAYGGRTLASSIDDPVITYDLKFTVTHKLQITT
jgi:hypothetical protein